MAHAPASLRLQNVSKYYGNRAAVRQVDLDLRAGSTTALIGPSGCGKSTLLRLMIGLIEPDQGQVILDGLPIDGGNRTRVRRRMGYVIQDGGLFPHLTARGNVALMASYLGWKKDRIDSRVTELCGLTDFPQDGLDRYPGQLSGGQRQRVGLMRALMLDPDVLLLDEPMGALDPMIRSALQHDLREIFRRLRKTVVLVTHDLAEAGFLGQVIVLVRDGQIEQKGSLNDLLGRPSTPFVKEFINAQRPLQAEAGWREKA